LERALEVLEIVKRKAFEISVGLLQLKFSREAVSGGQTRDAKGRLSCASRQHQLWGCHMAAFG
jgi:hypothetical protein